MQKRFIITILALVSLVLAQFSVVCGEEVEIDYGPNSSLLPSNGEMYGWITDMWEMGAQSEMGFRYLGTQGDIEAVDYTLNKFQEFGLEAWLEPIELPVALPSQCSLTFLENGQSMPASWISYTAFTEPDGITHDMVYVGEGTAADFDAADVTDKIVVVDIRFPIIPLVVEYPTAYLVWDPENTLQGYRFLGTGMYRNFKPSYQRAVENGARGYIGILKDMPANLIYTHCPYSGEFRDIPGLWVGRDDGVNLRSLLQQGPSKARIVSEGIVTTAVTHNVMAKLQGKTEKSILVDSHHDGWAVNDAAGAAVTLGIAKYFSQIPKESREKTLYFVLTPHFYDNVGTEVFMHNHPELMADMVTIIGIEHVGKEYVEQDGALVENGLVSPRIFWASDSQLASYCVEAVKRYDLRRTFVEPVGDFITRTRPAPMTNVPFGEVSKYYQQSGVPVIGHFCWPAYMFINSEDTPDKVAIDQLKPSTAAFVDIISSIDAEYQKQ